MATTGASEEEGSIHQPKRSRTGFKVGPQNLADGTWRRKVIKIKKELIHKAKVKKTYAKIKLGVPALDAPVQANETGVVKRPPLEPLQEMHPERQVMLGASGECMPLDQQRPQLERKRRRRPVYFEKEAAFAQEQMAEAAVKRTEFEKRSQERQERIAERERFRKSMSKARLGGRYGQRKLGRESKILLEKVKRNVES